MTIPAKSRGACLSLSCILSLAVAIIIIICLFSTGYRWLDDKGNFIRGKRSFGLLRYCWDPYETKTHSASPDTDGHLCYRRSKPPNDEKPLDLTYYYADFEMITLILLSISAGSIIIGLCFAICSIFTKFGALSHCVMQLVATICCTSGFVVYTYFNDLRENQSEIISGTILMYHYGWAYYCTGACSVLSLLAFICSVFGSAFFIIHSSEKNKSKVESIPL
ncbi:unnamed protein product [Auanema sp. JU1783]|nr:unnamed protein product [Auanema sp. JU1783]